MIYNNLGKSGLQISALSLGSWVTFGNQITDDVAEDLMQLAYEHGVNFFDNAETYANGKSEIVMGKILKSKKWDRTSYLISSKVFFGDGRKLPNQTGLSRKHIIEACNDALKRLQLEYLDLYLCHRPDKTVPIEEVVWTMHNLIQSGKIFYWGTSEWSAAEIMEAYMIAKQNHLIGPILEQPQYNMFHRSKLELEYQHIFRTVGLGTTIWSPLASGTLTDKYLKGFPKDTRMSLPNYEWIKEKSITDEKISKVKALHLVARELNMTLPQLGICWCLKNPNVSTVILGASKVHQLEETLQSIDHLAKLTPEVMENIDYLLDNKPK